MRFRLICDPAVSPGGYERDVAGLLACMKAKNESLGYESWLPPLSDCTAVFVCEDKGRIVGGFVFKRVEELIVVGDEPAILQVGLKKKTNVFEILRRRGVDSIIGFVPDLLMVQYSQKKPAMARIMKRLKMDRIKKFVCFERQL